MATSPPSVGAKTIIAAHAAGSGWQIEIGVMPTEPDNIIVITDTVGLPANPKWLIDFPTLQVMVRGNANGYLDTYNEAKAVKDLLLGITSFDLLGDRWDSVTLNGDLGFIGRDDAMRPIFTMNFALIIEPQVVAESNRLPL